MWGAEREEIEEIVLSCYKICKSYLINMDMSFNWSQSMWQIYRHFRKVFKIVKIEECKILIVVWFNETSVHMKGFLCWMEVSTW